MGFDQFALVVVNFLPETDGCFIGINFLQITRLPAKPARHAQTITPPASGQLFPLAELFFILMTGAPALAAALFHVNRPGRPGLPGDFFLAGGSALVALANRVPRLLNIPALPVVG